MLQIKQNEYLLKNRRETQYLNKKQLNFLKDTTITSDDSDQEIEKKKEMIFDLKFNKRKFEWDKRSLNFLTTKHTKQFTVSFALQLKKQIVLFKSFIKKIKKHLKPEPPYILTPDGSIKMIWDMICLMIVIYEMISVPFSISFDIEISSDMSTFSLIIFIIDMFLTFNTGVYIDGNLKMDRTIIFKDYLSFWFWIDLTSTFPYDVIVDESARFIQGAKLLRLFRFLKFVRILKLLRLAKLKKIFDKFDEIIINFKILGVILTFAKLFCLVLFMAHCLGCTFHFLATQEDESWLGDDINSDWQTRYILSLYWGVETMTTIGYGDVSPQTYSERLLGIFLLLIACGGFAFTMNSIGFAIGSLEEKEKIRKNKVNAITRYMKKAKIPDVLQNKIKKYLEFVWNNQSILLEDITRLLPEELSHDIQGIVNGQIFSRIELIWNIHTKRFVTIEIIPILKEELFMPEEIIFQEGQNEYYDFFMIQKGEVDIYFQKTNIVIDKKEKYDYFGEISFYTNQARSASAISRTFSHIFKLQQLKFLQLLTNYPKDNQTYFTIRESINFDSDYSLIQVRCHICQMDDHLAINCPTLHFQVNAPHFLSFLHQYNKIQQTTYIRKDRQDFNARGSIERIQQCQIRFLRNNVKRRPFKRNNFNSEIYLFNYYDLEDDIEDGIESNIKKLEYQTHDSLQKFQNQSIFDDNTIQSKFTQGGLTQKLIYDDIKMDQIASDKFKKLLKQISEFKEKKKLNNYIEFSLIPNLDQVKTFTHYFEKNNIQNVIDSYNQCNIKGIKYQLPPKYIQFGIEEFQSYLDYYCYYVDEKAIIRYFTKSQLNIKLDEYHGFEQSRLFSMSRVEKKRTLSIKKTENLIKFKNAVKKMQHVNTLKNSKQLFSSSQVNF